MYLFNRLAVALSVMHAQIAPLHHFSCKACLMYSFVNNYFYNNIYKGDDEVGEYNEGRREHSHDS
jgi:hypothetical protein